MPPDPSQRNAVIPNLHLQFRFFPSEDTVFGIALDYKRLVPRLESEKGIAVQEKIDSIIFQVYGAYNAKRLQIRSKVVYGQNGSDQILLSGYAVETRNKVTGAQTYSNTASVSAWIDAAYWFDEQTKSVGIFGGYTKNLGSSDCLFIDPSTKQPIVFAFDPDIDYVGRVSTRFRYIYKAFHIGRELEFIRASYGTLNRRAEVIRSCPVDNIRLLGEILYYF